VGAGRKKKGGNNRKMAALVPCRPKLEGEKWRLKKEKSRKIATKSETKGSPRVTQRFLRVKAIGTPMEYEKKKEVLRKQSNCGKKGKGLREETEFLKEGGYRGRQNR